MNKLHLSDHYTYKNIFRAVIAPICMMIFTSIYSIVDGFFISNYVGTSAFAGVNLIFPVIMIVAAIGFMFGTGGSALVSKLLGEAKNKEANKTFSLIVYSSFGVGLIVATIMFFLVEPIANAFASLNSDSSNEMIEAAILYGRIMIVGTPIYILQNTFQSFFAVNEKSVVGFIYTLVAGLTNIFLDFLFVSLFGFGIIGAAVASISGMLIGAVGPLFYFLLKKDLLVRLGKPSHNFKSVLTSCLNGLSEFVTNISSSIVSIVFNAQLLKYIGEDGISAYGIIMYVSFLFVAIFFGYNIGISPVIGYNYGAKNSKELSNVFTKSMIIVSVTGLLMTALSYFLSDPFSYVFAKSSETLHQITTHAMKIYSLTFVMCGFSIFGSAFFTALNNGVISAIISLLRTLVFQLVFVFIFPLFMGVDGIWFSIVFAELASLFLTLFFVINKSKKYGYKFAIKEKNTVR